MATPRQSSPALLDPLSAELGSPSERSFAPSPTRAQSAPPEMRRDPDRERGWYNWVTTENLIDNEASTARDYLARERNYLSWVKLSVTLSAVSAALLTHFQFGQQDLRLPSWELDMNLPLGALFFIAGVASLAVGCAGFYQIQNQLIRRNSFVGRGGITDSVIWAIGALTLVTCILLLVGS